MKLTRICHNLFLNYFILALFFYFFLKLIGGPFLTPDSFSYINQSKNLLANIGSWHPLGYSVFLKVIANNGQNLIFATSVLIVFFVFSFSKLTEKVLITKKSKCLAIVALVFLWLIPMISVWSEALFMSILMLSIRHLFLMNDSVSLDYKNFLILMLLMIMLILTRSTGVFFLPVFCIGTFIIFKKHISIKLSILISTIIFFIPLFVSKSSVGLTSFAEEMNHKNQICKQSLISLNRLPLCDLNSMQQVCLHDTQNLIGPNGKFDMTSLNFLHFDKSSPYMIWQNSYSTNYCDLLKLTYLELITHIPFKFISNYVMSFLNLYGKAESTELGRSYKEVTADSFIPALDKSGRLASYMLSKLVFLVYLVPFLLIFVSKFFNFQIIVLYALSISHALGLALNNSFLVLRYQIIHQSLLLFCLIFIYKLIIEHKTKNWKPYV